MPRMPNPMDEITRGTLAWYSEASPDECAKYDRAHMACRFVQGFVPELCASPAEIAAYKRVASPEAFALYERRREVWRVECDIEHARIRAENVARYGTETLPPMFVDLDDA